MIRAFAVVLPVALAVALAACSGSNDAGANADASIGPAQPLGAACNPSLSNACAPAATACSVSECASGVCVQLLVQGDPSCTDAARVLPPTNTLCATSTDCEAGVCGFLSNAGCSVTGVCVTPEPASALPPAACGCDGLPDPYVANGFTGAPASNAAPCVDAGAADGAMDDASLDGAVDAARDSGDGDAGSADAAGGDASDGATE